MGYVAGATAAVVVLLLSACTPQQAEEPEADPSASSPSDTTDSAESSGAADSSGSAESTAAAVARPRAGDCYRITQREAVAPVNDARTVDCDKQHTAQTFKVGALDLVRDGHLLAVDSAAAQQQVAEACPDALGGHLRGGPEALRLSVLQSVWFTPSFEQATSGAGWFRCDVVALGADDALAPLPKRTVGLLATAAGRERFGLCATAEPGTPDFERVPCGSTHSWRALATVDLPGQDYPSAEAAGRAMADRCRSAARAAAEDPLDFSWSEERPTRQQWQAGLRHGICWAPD
jgi:hypothetical protein